MAFGDSWVPQKNKDLTNLTFLNLFHIIITIDMTINITKCFETYQIRWSTEGLAKDSKQYLGLGRYQDRDFNGQIVDCKLCHMPCIALALDKRLNDYETMGALFDEQRAAF